MCRFKFGQQDTNCNHDECKTYYRLSELENGNCSQKKVKIEATNTEKDTIGNISEVQNIQQTNNTKKVLDNIMNPVNIDYQNYNANKDTNKDMINNLNTMNNILYNNILNQNNNHLKIQNTSNNNHQIYISQLQSANQIQQQNQQQHQQLKQQNNTNTNSNDNNNNSASNQQLSQAALTQLLTQNMKIKPLDLIYPQPKNPITNILQSNIDINRIYEHTNVNKSIADSLGTITSLQQHLNNSTSNNGSVPFEFQNRILNLMITQNKMLVNLKEKNDMLQDSLAGLINEINTLRDMTKTTVSSSNDKELTKISGNNLFAHQQNIINSTEIITIEYLLNFLYGTNPDFQYQLILQSELSLPLYRERNFRFTVLLTDKNGNLIKNANHIPITIGIYSSENPPKYIDTNTTGKKILKGMLEKDLVDGQVSFEKIQIKEVTSHFRNGWVFLIVYPKLPQNDQINASFDQHNMINHTKIKPLILEKVIVRAKKSKDKGLNDSIDLYNEDDYKLDKNDQNSHTSNKEETIYSG